jgi:hypothetical protein
MAGNGLGWATGYFCRAGGQGWLPGLVPGGRASDFFDALLAKSEKEAASANPCNKK